MEKVSQVAYNPYKNRSKSRKKSKAGKSSIKEKLLKHKEKKEDEKEEVVSRNLSARRKARMNSSRTKTNFSMNISHRSSSDVKEDQRERKRGNSSKNSLKNSATKNTFFTSLNSSGLDLVNILKSRAKEKQSSQQPLFKEKKNSPLGKIIDKEGIKDFIEEKKKDLLLGKKDKDINFNLRKNSGVEEMTNPHKIKSN